MRRLARSSMASGFVCLLSYGLLWCGSDLPRPSYVAQTTDALAPVSYPPPPARVETVPLQPAKGAVWLDGEWVWQGRTFAWRKGRWVKPPRGARYSPWTAVRGEDGTFYFAGGAWQGPDHDRLPDPPALATAKSTPGPVVDSEGHMELTGHTVHESQTSPATPSDVPLDGGAMGSVDAGAMGSAVEGSMDAAVSGDRGE